MVRLQRRVHTMRVTSDVAPDTTAADWFAATATWLAQLSGAGEAMGCEGAPSDGQAAPRPKRQVLMPNNKDQTLASFLHVTIVNMNSLLLA